MLLIFLFESQYPMKYVIAPPIYDNTPRILRKRNGALNFEDREFFGRVLSIGWKLNNTS
jgi:hypothetical protein